MLLDQRRPLDRVSTSNLRIVTKTPNKVNTTEIHFTTHTSKNPKVNGSKISDMSTTSFTKIWRDKTITALEAIHMVEKSKKDDQTTRVWRCLLYICFLGLFWLIQWRESCFNDSLPKKNFIIRHDTKGRMWRANLWYKKLLYTHLILLVQMLPQRRMVSCLGN